MPAADATLFALSDPTRRSIVERIRARPGSVAEIARGLPISRPAVSQHLAVLKRTGLVTEQRLGRRHIYRLEAAGLEPLRCYVESLWTDVLTAYRQAAEAEARAQAQRGGGDAQTKSAAETVIAKSKEVE